MSFSQPVQELLDDWYHRTRESQFGHFGAAKYYGSLHYYLGIPVVVLSGVVGTSLFASIGKTAAVPTVIIGMVSVLVAVLGSLQTFLRFSERAEKHRVAAARYGAIRREIEQVRSLNFDSNENMREFIDKLRKRLDNLAEESPAIPRRVWRNNEATYTRAGLQTKRVM
jgi:hypothetical protein